jgi:hypothetical protein
MSGEQASASTNGTHDEAAVRFDGIISTTAKMTIVEHAVKTHRASLKLQHANLLMVCAGYRARRAEEGVYALHKLPCVVLVVEEKWPKESLGEPKMALPERLEVAVGVGDRTIMYAVPTDVQPSAWIRGLSTQSNNGIVVAASPPCNGTITCGVELSTAAGPMWYALSAMHVLSPSPPLDADARAGEAVGLAGSGQLVGASTSYAGRIRSDAPSFDAQLAAIDAAAINALFADLQLGYIQIAHSRADINFLASKSAFYVRTAANRLAGPLDGDGKITGQFCYFAEEDLKLTYVVTSSNQSFPAYVTHADLLVIAAGENCPVSESGDSGSPVFASYNGQDYFVGMLIAGPAKGSDGDRMVVLPTWVLFDPENWSCLPPGTVAFRPTFLVP